MSKGPLVSTDADILVYRGGFASEKWMYRGTRDDLQFEAKNKTLLKEAITEAGHELSGFKVKKFVKPDPVQFALHTIKEQIGHILESTKADDFNLYLTGEGNYREQVATFLPYKGNRMLKQEIEAHIAAGEYTYYFEGRKLAGTTKPYHYDAIREYLIDYWDAEVIGGMEADDMLAIKQSEAYHNTCITPDVDIKKYLRSNGHIVASIDKDLMQVPGWYFDFRTEDQRKAGVPDWYYVTEEEADLNLWAQVASGDMTDCIFGIAGISFDGAKKKLKDVKNKEKEVESMYQAWFKKMDEADKLKPMERYLIDNYDWETYMDEVYQLIRLKRFDDEEK